jgi:TRAP-type C4-dicarboxylate transport system substrate-binding protein
MLVNAKLARPLLLAGIVAILGLAPALGAPAHRAHAQDAQPITLRIATIAPRGSAWHRVFTAWGNSLRTQTQGRLTIQVQAAGGSDETDLVRRLRAHELDGASFTALGIAQIARPVLVLQAPGVYDDYAQLDRARTAMDAEIRQQLEQNGVVLMGWSDYGRARIFSTCLIAQPSDFRSAHPWLPEGDTMFPEFLRAAGATGVALRMSDVRGALEAGRIDTVVASATAVSALQWHTRLTHVTQQSSAVLIGATLFDKARVDALPADLQQALRDTARQAHETLQRTVRRDDDRYYETLVSRGMTPVDATAHEAAWRQSAQRAREALIGSVYSRQQLDRAIAAGR